MTARTDALIRVSITLTAPLLQPGLIVLEDTASPRGTIALLVARSMRPRRNLALFGTLERRSEEDARPFSSSCCAAIA